MMRFAFRRAGRALPLALAAALATTACTTATPYQPLNAPGARASGGYSDQQLEPGRWRVSFQGNSMTARQTVENFLLYRAAELTVQQGYDWFEAVHRDTEKKSDTYVDRPFSPGPWGYWGVGWRYHGAFGWRGWNPWFGGPFWADDFDVQTVDRYEASAEIVMHRGAKPEGNPAAFDARSVMQMLGPQTAPPV